MLMGFELGFVVGFLVYDFKVYRAAETQEAGQK